MPRTKMVKKKPAPTLCPWAAAAIEKIEAAKKTIHLKLDQDERKVMSLLKTQLSKSKLGIPVTKANKTLGELADLPLNWSGNNTTTSTSVLQALNATRTLSTVTEKKKPLTRSSSFADDEGYLTAESSNGTSGGRKSRARSKTFKTDRTSRSLSTKAPRTVDRLKTPAQKIPQSSYGMITPKVKPNTPQVLLRRPKQGEVALSLQGSPLLTGSVVTDNVANINIPLDDGRLLSIQPQRGLRLSQIPALDGELKRQLETLRDNLNKVCAVSARR